MRGMGFLVDEVTEWPDDNEMVRNYHVVIVRVRAMNGAPCWPRGCAPSRISGAGCSSPW